MIIIPKIIIPMAGIGQRFKQAGYKTVKPFISQNGKMMIELVLEQLSIPNAEFYLIIQKSFLKEYNEELSFLKNKFNIRYLEVDGLTEGAACTVLSAHKILNHEQPFLIADADNIFQLSDIIAFIEATQKQQLDASVVTLNSDFPGYSYIKINDVGFATDVKEKVVISEYAIAGAYYFASGSTFVDYTIQQMIYGKKQVGEFYISNILKSYIQAGLKVGHHLIDPNHFDCLGTPEQYEEFIHE